MLTLAIDQGTHASRAILYDAEGNIQHSEWQPIELRRRQQRIEQDPQQLSQSVEQCVTGLLAKLNSQERQQITRCGLTTQRSTLIPCDDSGAALAPAISWQDTRAAEFVDTLEADRQRIQQISGLPLSAHYGASKMRWLLRHHPDTTRLAPLASYLLMQLVDADTFLIDPANAQRTQLLDISQHDWSDELLTLFDIPDSASLPVCVPSQHQYGTLLNTGIPVCAVSGDQNAALYAAGKPDKHTAFINLGSGGFIMFPTDHATVEPPLLTSIGYSSQQTAHYFREGTINGAGTALEWIKQRYSRDDWWPQLASWLENIHQPPVFINSIGQLGSPWWRTDIPPAFIHETTEHDIRHQAVAVAESIVFLVLNNLERLQQQHDIQKLYVSGGVSQLDGLCQKLANLGKLPVTRFKTRETTSRGIAWLAQSRPSAWQREPERVFEPLADSRLDERYHQFTTYLEIQ